MRAEVLAQGVPQALPRDTELMLDFASGPTLEVSVVMPCLNEARTIVTCIEKAHAALRGSGLTYEIVIGDNGSTDGSQELAKAHGARVIAVPRRGYGEAYRGAIAAARGDVLG
jgi:glycosyltransferase involved in cell wall biosynthesis